ncbi:MAG: hypothetical protein IPK16_21925, partial [Anaerolineales bacterium]|nr:hypothetical protein [Anaerolineales bacterium]
MGRLQYRTPFFPTGDAWIGGSHYIATGKNCTSCATPVFFTFGRARDYTVGCAGKTSNLYLHLMAAMRLEQPDRPPVWLLHAPGLCGYDSEREDMSMRNAFVLRLVSVLLLASPGLTGCVTTGAGGAATAEPRAIENTPQAVATDLVQVVGQTTTLGVAGQAVQPAAGASIPVTSAESSSIPSVEDRESMLNQGYWGPTPSSTSAAAPCYTAPPGTETNPPVDSGEPPGALEESASGEATQPAAGPSIPITSTESEGIPSVAEREAELDQGFYGPTEPVTGTVPLGEGLAPGGESDAAGTPENPLPPC